ncbi:MAG: amino acid synthesis family protein [Alphaproteobacteria bacterium]|nr:amino acid synthesis family protein [Alphaproteobacteria bacterium]
MVEIKIRKYHTLVDETFHEGGPVAGEPIRAAAVLAVVENPYAGRYEPDITPMMEALKPLGLEMSRRLIDALGGDPGAIESYGKGAIVGEAGELEHCALWHVPGGYAMRQLLGDAAAIVPSSVKVGGMGARLDVPLGHINAAYVRSHFSGMEVSLNDAPRANEIVFVLAMTTGGRIHERVGGLRADEIKGEDGLR